MAWIYFQDTAELKTHFEDVSVQLPIVKLSRARAAFFCDGCGRVRLQRLQSGMTCGLCGNAISPHQLTSSQAGSHARTLALQELAKAWTESEAAFSSRSLGLHASLDPHSCSWKMSQGCLFEGWTESARSWPRQGMTIGGECYQLTTWERHTCGSECGYLLPTPNASDSGGYNKSASAGAKKRYGLIGMARRGLLPTATATDYKQRTHYGNGSLALLGAIQISDPKAKYLNPQFVEAMMGLPIGATELEHSEMVGFRKRRGRRSGGSAA